MKALVSPRHAKPAVRRQPAPAAPLHRTSEATRAALHPILRLSMVQPKLAVGAVNDAHEREADAMSERVMRMPAPAGALTAPAMPSGDVQRKEQPKPDEIEEEEKKKKVQRLEAPAAVSDDEAKPKQAGGAKVSDALPEPWPEPSKEESGETETVQRKAAAPAPSEVSSSALASRIVSPASGESLPSPVRGFMEPRFGRDFSGVRVHETPQDRADAGALGARAFTYGNHIWLGPNERASDMPLMAHELTHVVQQGGAVRRQPAIEIASTTPKVQREAAEAAPSGIIGEVLERVRGWVKKMPGYSLLTVVLGRDPITKQPVERSAVNIARGVLDLVPGGDAIFENLQKSGAIEKTAAWLQEQIALLDLTWEKIKQLFNAAVDAVSIWHPGESFDRIVAVFAAPAQRLKNFAVSAGRKVLEFVFEGAMALAGPLGQQVLAVVRKAGNVVNQIIENPIGFLGNLLAAVKQGFQQFSSNILEHLKKGLMDWLFGTLAKAGVQLPQKFDLGGIVSLIMQILGLTYAALRAKLVKVVGESRMAAIEKGVDLLVTVVTKGLAAAWEKILEYADNLYETVIGGIRDWVVTKVVTAAVTKIATMFNPVGAVIQAIKTIYDTVVFFVERAKQIAELANAVFDSIANIAAGKIGAAADYVEKTMARAIPVLIGFLASLIGLGGIADRIREIIEKIRGAVDKALNKVVNFIVQKAAALLAKGKAAVGALVEWWKQKTPFEVNGEKHTVFFEGSQENATLYVQSEKKTIVEYLDAIPPASADATALASAKQHAADLAKSRPSGMDAETHGNQKVILYNKLAALLPKLPLAKGQKLPPSVVKYGPIEPNLGASEMEAKILTKHNEPGTGVDDSWPLWEDLKPMRHGTGEPNYVLGHLLNNNLGGKGKMHNLTPITNKANGDHLRNVESSVKEWVKKDKVVYYKVKAVYGGSPKTKGAEQIALEKQANPDPIRLRALNAERKLVREIAFKAHVLEEVGGAWEKKKKPTPDEQPIQDSVKNIGSAGY